MAYNSVPAQTPPQAQQSVHEHIMEALAEATDIRTRLHEILARLRGESAAAQAVSAAPEDHFVGRANALSRTHSEICHLLDELEVHV